MAAGAGTARHEGLREVEGLREGLMACLRQRPPWLRPRLRFALVAFAMVYLLMALATMAPPLLARPGSAQSRQPPAAPHPAEPTFGAAPPTARPGRNMPHPDDATEDDEEEEAEKTWAGKAAPPAAQRSHFHGQSHAVAAPRPLIERWRRALRDSLARGGADLWFTPRAIRDSYFLAYDTSGPEHYLTLGAKHARRGDLATPGWRFLAMLGVKVAAREALLDRRITYPDLMRLMPGYEAHLGRLRLAGYLGLGFARSQLPGILATRRPGRFGGVAFGEFLFDWQGFAPGLAGVSAGHILVDGAQGALSLGLRHGLAPPKARFLIGPEASWSLGRNIRGGGTWRQRAYRKARIGGHISEIPLFALRISLSAGAQWLDRRSPGAYAELAVHLAY